MNVNKKIVHHIERNDNKYIRNDYDDWFKLVNGSYVKLNNWEHLELEYQYLINNNKINNVFNNEFNLNECADMVHKASINKGFWDKKLETGTLLMLCVSELSEALEADRRNKFADLKKFNKDIINLGESIDPKEFFVLSFLENIKDTFEDELADTIIRILDLCSALNIDIDRHIDLKLKYNTTRVRMHGKKY